MSEKEWIEHLTVRNYFTPNEIEYRKHLILKDNINYEKLLKKINSYREKNRIEFVLDNETFYFVETKYIKKEIEKIKNFWKSPGYILQKKFIKNLLIDTLIAEAYNSSSIEGAHSTKKRTEELIKKNKPPKNRSEKMIVNNFKALEYISDKTEPISKDLILKLHSIVSKETLEQNETGVFRNDAVDIVNQSGKIIFSPTGDINKMHRMLDDLMQFINTGEDGVDQTYIDIIYKIIIFHFIFGYIHPFFDGNGRVVRILFTYLLKNSGYDMFYISLSEIINNGKNRKKYEEAFLKTERNNKDLTYFFYFIIDIMKEALEILEKRIFIYLKEDIITEKIKKSGLILTDNQEIIIKIISKEKNNLVHIDTISKKMKKSYQTVYKNIKTLTDYNLLKKRKIGRKIFYELNLKENT